MLRAQFCDDESIKMILKKKFIEIYNKDNKNAKINDDLRDCLL